MVRCCLAAVKLDSLLKVCKKLVVNFWNWKEGDAKVKDRIFWLSLQLIQLPHPDNPIKIFWNFTFFETSPWLWVASSATFRKPNKNWIKQIILQLFMAAPSTQMNSSFKYNSCKYKSTKQCTNVHINLINISNSDFPPRDPDCEGKCWKLNSQWGCKRLPSGKLGRQHCGLIIHE